MKYFSAAVCHRQANTLRAAWPDAKPAATVAQTALDSFPIFAKPGYY